MADEVIDAAQQQASSPANVAPDERATEQQRLALQSDLYERDALVAGGIGAARNIYGLTVPQEITNLGKDAVENYESNFSQWESDFLIEARDHGLDNKLVGQLRDAGVKLGLQVDGKPLTDEVVDGALKEFEGRLTATQAKALKAYWRRIEGGGAA